jgi:hypothetical protein
MRDVIHRASEIKNALALDISVETRADKHLLPCVSHLGIASAYQQEIEMLCLIDHFEERFPTYRIHRFKNLLLLTKR